MNFNHDYILFVEDDMEISPDFYTYFQATLPLMKRDPTIWAVSSWNDNGQARFAIDHKALVRSDFFPGLGWGTSKEIWQELAPIWPGGYWDDWMREPQHRRGRVTIRPEISRNRNFGKEGASGGQFFDQYITSVQFNQENVAWLAEDLSYLMKDTYDRNFLGSIRAATVVLSLDGIPLSPTPRDYRIEYQNLQQYEAMAARNGLMPDSKAGVPRCGYLMTVMIKYNNNRVFYSPPLGQLPIS